MVCYYVLENLQFWGDIVVVEEKGFTLKEICAEIFIDDMSHDVCMSAACIQVIQQNVFIKTIMNLAITETLKRFPFSGFDKVKILLVFFWGW